jgi:hypothetical protein
VHSDMRLPPAGETNAADITGGTCLPYNDKPPLHYRILSKRQFLGDTGSDLRLIPRWRERINYDLYAANGTTIHTYGWLPLSLN